ncbi:MAG TPA: hypothetical protein VMG10_00565 [Gemmataceae bacterium]|nr:hypothetical protein [Gemmataceae bacterium]
MRAVSRIVGFAFLGVLLSLPALAADEKDKKAAPKKDDGGNKSTVQKPDARKAKEKPAERWIKAGTVAGKLSGVNEAKKTLRFHLEVAKGKWVDPEWQATDDVKVRTRNPPPAFDDKGKPKRYTKKELRELQGDPKLPGFPAEFSDLKTGQYVQVTLVQKKGGRRKPKNAADDPTGEYAPHMSLIVILSDPNNK